MQFEGNDIDKKIKDAADNHYPPYNDGAWKKMESLLEKHLPQRKEKRRIVLFLLLFLLLGGGSTYLLISKPWNSGKLPAITQQNEQQQTDPLKGKRRDTEKISENLSSRTGIDDLAEKKKHSIPEEKPLTIQLKRKQYIDAAQELVNSNMKKIMLEPLQLSELKTEPKDDLKKDESKIIADANIQEMNTVKNNEIKTEQKAATIDQKDTKTEESKTIASSKNTRQKKNNAFFFSISTGPDISSVGNDFGRTKLFGGIGLGYTFNDKFTLRTGFYTARKIYTAEKEYYKPDVTPPGYNYLQNVSANCKVYEIPLSLTFHFGRSAKQNFFASAGLSSYLMKKEDYDYNYVYPGNVPYTHRYSFENENNHYFSVAGISIGYQRNISKTFSLIAEPYVRIPLNGVGQGNVKLNSGGISFSAMMRPFQNTGKQKKTTLSSQGQ